MPITTDWCVANGNPPTITPPPHSLTEGYATTNTGNQSFAFSGPGPITITKLSGPTQLTWGNANYRVNIATGLPAGIHSIVLRASNIFGYTDITFNVEIKESILPLPPTNIPANNVGNTSGHNQLWWNTIVNSTGVVSYSGVNIAFTGAGGYQISPAIDFQINKWYLVIARSENRQIQVRDANSIRSGVSGNIGAAQMNSIHIGGMSSSYPNRHMYGFMRNIFITPKTLTDAEILTIFNHGNKAIKPTISGVDFYVWMPMHKGVNTNLGSRSVTRSDYASPVHHDNGIFFRRSATMTLTNIGINGSPWTVGMWIYLTHIH